LKTTRSAGRLAAARVSPGRIRYRPILQRAAEGGRAAIAMAESEDQVGGRAFPQPTSRRPSIQGTVKSDRRSRARGRAAKPRVTPPPAPIVDEILWNAEAERSAPRSSPRSLRSSPRGTKTSSAAHPSPCGARRPLGADRPDSISDGNASNHPDPLFARTHRVPELLRTEHGDLLESMTLRRP